MFAAHGPRNSEKFQPGNEGKEPSTLCQYKFFSKKLKRNKIQLVSENPKVNPFRLDGNSHEEDDDKELTILLPEMSRTFRFLCKGFLFEFDFDFDCLLLILNLKIIRKRLLF